jgi:hypothetical protein
LKRKIAKRNNKKRRAGIEPPAYINAIKDEPSSGIAVIQSEAPPPYSGVIH